jgi:hypothetical protein
MALSDIPATELPLDEADIAAVQACGFATYADLAEWAARGNPLGAIAELGLLKGAQVEAALAAAREALAGLA